MQDGECDERIKGQVSIEKICWKLNLNVAMDTFANIISRVHCVSICQLIQAIQHIVQINCEVLLQEIFSFHISADLQY